MGCSNCFNGCTEIVSDKCVKYTGIPIPGLGINTGDNLLTVENQITSKLLELMNGTGIVPILDANIICSLVNSFLPCCEPITLNHVITALIKSICNLDGKVAIIQSVLLELNADYNVDCLDGVVNTSNTHAVVQAIIDKLCQVETDLETLTLEVTTNYVLKSELDSLISSYLETIPANNLYNSKMVPYIAYEYYGPTVGFFDITGAGIGDWVKVNLCNGQNGTPDKRGRVAVGATTMGPAPYDAAVDPANPANPAYSVNTKVGVNTVILTPLQMPSHNHPGSYLNDPGHLHYIANGNTGANTGSSGLDSTRYMNHYKGGNESSYFLNGDSTVATIGKTSSTPAANHALNIANDGGGTGHPNIQPGIGAYYIMYIP